MKEGSLIFSGPRIDSCATILSERARSSVECVSVSWWFVGSDCYKREACNNIISKAHLTNWNEILTAKTYKTIEHFIPQHHWMKKTHETWWSKTETSCVCIPPNIHVIVRRYLGDSFEKTSKLILKKK